MYRAEWLGARSSWALLSACGFVAGSGDLSKVSMAEKYTSPFFFVISRAFFLGEMWWIGVPELLDENW